MDRLDELTIFRAIGEMWLWAGHLRKDGEQIAQLLDDPSQEVFAATSPKSDVGLLQLHYDTQDDAEVVYHEYTHGLTNRLVLYPDGSSGLSTQQSNSMGEGWSDWYAEPAVTELLEAAVA